MTQSKKRISLFLVGIVLIFLTYIAKGYYDKVYASNVETNDRGFDLYIPTGATAIDVFNLLNYNGVLKDTASYQWIARKKNYDGGNVVPGKYRIGNGWSNNRLINHLRAGNGRLDVAVQFNQIKTKAQLAGRLSNQIEPDSLSIYGWLTNGDSISAYGFNEATITAMFIPNTYHLTWNTSTPQLMRRMAKEYKSFWTAERKSKANSIGLSQSEVSTLASIVYWETKYKADMVKVAGVYMNRLRIGMPLQADPTLIFAIGDFSLRRVLNKDKAIDSPYNTYKNKGLPPGPILIPPVSYIDAVLNHERHDYYYFVAKEDMSGESYFAKSYNQHLIYAKRFQRALNERGIKR